MNQNIPSKFHSEVNQKIKNAIDYFVINDPRDPNAKYCTGVMINGIIQKTKKQKHRSSFNDEKTKWLRPELYSVLKNDKQISFVYSTKKEEERTDRQILDRFGSMPLF